MDRSTFSPTDIVEELWANLGLPRHATSATSLESEPGGATSGGLNGTPWTAHVRVHDAFTYHRLQD
ncbi:hypothetical protein LX36DRAFT_660018 [Colletotrichum falcatum]|nr:hypothetical protein LX36DRAFT_660018 [Colletotrichum falcatum]